MGNECVDCRNWAARMYWSRLHPVHFCQILSKDFAHQLVIPKKFTKNFKEKLAGLVSLRGPSDKTWEVALVSEGDLVLLKDGWEKFATDHSLQENDILIFKYVGNSIFEVLIFNQENLCEREASYITGICAHMKSRSCIKRRRATYESVGDTTESVDDVRGNRPVKNPNMAGATISPSTQRPNQTSAKGVNGMNKGKRTRRINPKLPLKINHKSQLRSNRRKVTGDEIERVRRMALAELQDNGFMVVMRASHVYKGFYMAIPSEWARKYIGNACDHVVLRYEGKAWSTKCFHRGLPLRWVLGGRWMHFALENFLEEFDICLFDLVHREPELIILDVKIFRVVEDSKPPSAVHGITSRERGRKFVIDITGDEEDE